MHNLRESFEDVADWCEKHLEHERGQELGMIFGTMLRAYGRLATLPIAPSEDERAAKERELNAKAEEILRELSARFLVASGRGDQQWKAVEPTSMRTNMTYDTGSRAQEHGNTRSERPTPTSNERDTMSQPRFEIVQLDMGGWVRVFLGHGEPTGEVAKYLSHSLTEWIRKRPHLRLRFAVPITRDGDTVELHAWYDQVQFPDASPMVNPDAGAADS